MGKFLFIGLAKIAHILKAAAEGRVFGSGLRGTAKEASGVCQPQVQDITHHGGSQLLSEIVAKLGYGNTADFRQVIQGQPLGKMPLNIGKSVGK